MLDAELKEQLKTVFEPLSESIALVYEESSHADQAELVGMLEDVASTSSKIATRKSVSGKTVASPQFEIYKNDKPTGIIFKAIPGGHEFSSLILAILNASGKGKMPEAFLVQRIQKLKKPIHVQTYMSLTCENCPDVIQTLNQIALVHGNFTHEIIDGAYFQDDINRLSIQGVPSLIQNDKLIHSGRIQMIDLLSKLEQTFGIDASAGTQVVTPTDLGFVDVAVIGGGPAGASAAIYSVRKGLKTTLLAEKIGGQVSETKGIENLISVPYTEGPQLSDQLHKHVLEYPVQILENRRVKSISKDSPKKIELESGEFLTAQQVIVTTGAKWRELGVPGEKEYMGRGVAYCPHCDGPYYKGKKVAVVGGGNSGVEAAIDLAGIVKEVVLFEYNSDLKADKILVDKLLSMSNVSVVTNAKTQEITGNGQKVVGLSYQDRKTEKLVEVALDGVFIQIGLVPNSQFLKDSVELSKYGEIVIDEKCRTSTPGIYAAGDVTTTPFKQIIIAMGEGAKAALAAFEDRMHGK